MADRTLVHYTEPRREHGPYWTLDIDRSAAGKPRLMFTIRHEAFDGHSYPAEELTIVVEDAKELLAPVMEWLDQ